MDTCTTYPAEYSQGTITIPTKPDISATAKIFVMVFDSETTQTSPAQPPETTSTLSSKEEFFAYLRSQTPTGEKMWTRDKLYEEALC
ncbi:MAG: hypothetical protein FWG02_04445 [Holophagaceae bacterium]|nr:hypothetical protein [Holophagaceae bacterium]